MKKHRITVIILTVLLVGITSPLSARVNFTIDGNGGSGAVSTTSTGPVRVVGRQLEVDFDGDSTYEPYFIRGVGYNPYPVGTFPTEWGICEYCHETLGCFYDTASDDGFSCSAEQTGEYGGPKHPWGGQQCGGSAPYPNECVNLFDRGDVDLDRDFQALVDMNVNTIRTWEKITPTLLDKADQYDIKVIAGYWVGEIIDFDNPQLLNDIVADFKNYIEHMVADPNFSSVLFVAIGNENNYYYYVPETSPPDPPGCFIPAGTGPEVDNLRKWYDFVDRLAQEAKNVTGMDRPVAVVNGEIEEIGNVVYHADDSNLDNIDIWGVNAYRGISFGTMFIDYYNRSSKPLWISECGIDAVQTYDFYDEDDPFYDPQSASEFPQTQAMWDAKQWSEIISNSNTVIGATFMEYSDEWWKGVVFNQNHWDEFVREHNNTGICYQYYPSEGALPDSYFNEEWWGMMKTPDDSGPGIDLLVPRQAYYALKDSFSCSEGPNPYYAGPYNKKSCDGTSTCCPTSNMKSKAGQCVSVCKTRPTKLNFKMAL